MRYDIAINEDGTPIIENGDFVILPSDEQHVQDASYASAGHYGASPTRGWDLLEFQDDDTDVTEKMRRKINLELAADGYTLLSFELNGEIKFEPK